MTGWTKIKGAARYAGVSVRTLRGWLKKDLRHTRLPSGTILIKFSWLDEYLAGYEVQDNEVSQIVDKVAKEMGI
jgi:hypothetical protein